MIDATKVLVSPSIPKTEELVIDNFAGGGGASLGMAMALGREPDYAINHDEDALLMHVANHPGTAHLNEDVWNIDPVELTQGRPVGLAWFSPDCRHFSVARGSKPVSKRVRGLAWVTIKWAKKVKPRIIILENVKEFVTWGPLIKKRDQDDNVMYDVKGNPIEIPCPNRKGTTFKRWVSTLRNLGYDIEWKEIKACDFGAPTIRKRFFLIARCDGEPIVWPEPTHGPDLLPYRTAAQCIDWDIPCPSIFMDKEEAAAYTKATGKRVKRPLAENTMRRIAHGLMRYVIKSNKPFIVPVAHSEKGRNSDKLLGDRTKDTEEPLGTVTKTNDKALVVPYITPIQNYGSRNDGHKADEPLRTITAHPKGGGFAVTSAYMVQTGYGERKGQAPRSLDIQAPIGTIMAGGGKHAEVRAFLVKHFGGQIGTEVAKPFPTITQRGTQNQIVTSHLMKMRGTCKDGQPIDKPAPTVSAQGTHVAEVRAFLMKFYGSENGGHDVGKPIGTVTTKERFGLVTIAGEEYQIVDVGMRMLTPRELARCQGFPESYILTGNKTNQVAKIGNSVCPPVVRALVESNVELR